MAKRMLALAVLTGSVFTAAPAAAADDTEFQFRLTADYWAPKTTVQESKETIHTDPSASRLPLSASVEHNLPYLPDFRIRYTPVKGDYIEFNKFDYTLYYGVIDHELMHFDLGATWSTYANGDYHKPGQPERDFTQHIFSWYANAYVTVPDTNFDVIGEFDFAQRSGNKTADLTAGVRYRFKLNETDMAIRAGYRAMEYRFDYMNENDFYLTHGWFIGGQIEL